MERDATHPRETEHTYAVLERELTDRYRIEAGAAPWLLSAILGPEPFMKAPWQGEVIHAR